MSDSTYEKALANMSLKELWQLFPIVLTPHNPKWEQWYEEEELLLSELLTRFSPIITHIGSTAIDEIWSKPTIDILVEFPCISDLKEAAQTLSNSGYIIMNQKDERISLNKGYTPKGYAERVFHIHLRCQGDCDEILFRDYLRAHPDKAKEYEKLKLSLWKKYEHDRDGYTDAKSDFINECLKTCYKKQQ